MRSKKNDPSDTPIMPKKVGPNEPCPCGSEKKYKKCCFSAETMAKMDKIKQFTDAMLAMESAPMEGENLQRLNTYLLDRYGVPSINVTSMVNESNIKRVHANYANRDIFLLCERNPDTESVFLSKGAKPDENIMVMHKNNFLQYNSETEYDSAIAEMHKWRK
jgi:NAD-specific glutamate dehydrogenase